MKANILITGANGQLGSELSDRFAAFPQFNFIPTDIDTLDLTNADAVRQCIADKAIDYVINCAAYTAVDKAEDDIDLCYRVNRDAVRNIAKAASGRARVLHVSTDYVFDGSGSRPYREDDTTNPQTVYGKSKREGEEVLLDTLSESIVVRTAWLYSSYGNNFVKTMLRLGNERPEISVVADQKGSPTHAGDLAQALLDIIVKAEASSVFHPGIYHYSNEGETTWFEFTREIFRQAGIDCKVKPIATADYPTRTPRPAYSVLDKTKIKTTFGVAVPRWEDSLQRMW